MLVPNFSVSIAVSLNDPLIKSSHFWTSSSNLNFAFAPSPEAEKNTFRSNSLNSPLIAIFAFSNKEQTTSNVYHRNETRESFADNKFAPPNA